MRRAVVELATVIVGHLAPDLDCLAAIWILTRFGGAADADLQFVPAGATLGGLPADSDPRVIHVDTGGGRFDHHSPQHHRRAGLTCAAELVRRAVAPTDSALERIVSQICRLDNAAERPGDGELFTMQALAESFNLLFPTSPRQVAQAMLPNLDAWHAHEARQLRLEEAFARRIEFETPWGPGIALESADGGSSKLAYRHGAVLYVYRDGRGWMGVVAQARSDVDLSAVYDDLRAVDAGADWYLHPSRRMLLCGTAKSPPRTPSRLTLAELVRVVQGGAMFALAEDADEASDMK